MEQNIISEIHHLQNQQQHQQQGEDFQDLNFHLNDDEFEECLSLLSSNFQAPSTSQPLISVPSSSPSYTPYAPHTSYTPNIPPPPVPQDFQMFQTTPPRPSQKKPLSLTPLQQKIRQLLCVQRYQDVSKAGELAVRLAVLLFGNETLKRSGLGDFQGKLRALDAKKMTEIEDTIKTAYKGKGNLNTIWNKCHVAIAKKCQRLRSFDNK